MLNCHFRLAIETLSKERFNQPVKSLDKLQASGLIEELLAKYDPKKTRDRSSEGSAVIAIAQNGSDQKIRLEALLEEVSAIKIQDLLPWYERFAKLKGVM